MQLAPERPVDVDGLEWSDANRRAHTTDLEAARTAARALAAAGYHMAEARKLDPGIYRFSFRNPSAGLKRPGDPLQVAEVALVLMVHRRHPLPAQVAYRMPGEVEWHVPGRIGGDLNYWGDEQARQFGEDMLSMEFPDAAEVSTWPILLDD